ncbi:MAG TPA: lipid-A-disaccharide synthase N-terminal domain-containing protein [Chthoniobacterales bacterium]|nr:lipid-A-disaccharide synthase N-terminal domain-containing protein [Chthoniobacterales bacterium]
MTANLLFASRFAIQWYVSEKLKRSVIPVQFWYLSIVGSVMMLIYAIYIGKVPLILGFLFPTIIYIRNLMLIRKGERESKIGVSETDGDR